MKNFTSVARLASLLFVFQIVAPAQEQPAAAPTPTKLEYAHPLQIVWQKLYKENNYLAALLELKRREAEYFADPLLKADYLDVLSTQHSYVGDLAAMYDIEEKFLAEIEPRSKVRARNQAELKTSPLENFTARPAVDAIAAAADKEQIVIVNEEHRTPVHRALTYRLLSKFYAKGFRYLALETLRFEDTAELNKRGYPTAKSGSYTFEPIFGDMVRQALKLGFTLVAYEREGGCTKPADFIFCSDERESKQAQNIYDRILKNDPQAKILVHVGRDHALKGKIMENSFMMAGYLQNISGIEPFTVDQTRYSERRNPLDEEPLYRFLTGKNLLLKEPTVFESAVAEKKFYSAAPKRYNLHVFTPRDNYVNGRPDWLRLDGARREHRPKLKKLNLKSEKQIYKSAAPVLVQAFVAGESADAIPVDQIILYPEKKSPALMLPAKGAFEIKAVDESGKIVGSYRIK